MTFLLACNLKIVIKWWGLTFGDGSGGWGNKHLVGAGEIFQVGGVDEQILGWWGWGGGGGGGGVLPDPPSREKPCH